MRFKIWHKIRFFLATVIIFSNCYFHVLTLPSVYMQEHDKFYGLLWGIFGYVINLIIWGTAFCTTAEKGGRLFLLMLLTGSGMWIAFLHVYAGIALEILFASQIPEYFRMRWIKRQQGYPYFNERYQRQEDQRKACEVFSNPDALTEELTPQQIIVFSMPEENRNSEQ